jgi:hypothetical protein
MANGKIVYPSGAAPGDQVSYTFAKNFDYGHRAGYLETDDNVRTIDGSLTSYAGARKKTFELPFSQVFKSQLDALQLAWIVGADIDLYLDGDNPAPDATVQIMTPPQGETLKSFRNGVYTYSFDVIFEEV